MDEKYGPDWAKDHSDEFLATFRITDAERCVLGIMGREESEEEGDGEAGYSYLLDKWGLVDDGRYGFETGGPIKDWKVLQRTWEIALEDLIKY